MATNGKTAEIVTYYICIVCRRIPCEPWQLSCGHRLCRGCLPVCLSCRATKTFGGFPCPSGERDCKPFSQNTVFRDRGAERDMKRPEFKCCIRRLRTHFYLHESHVDRAALVFHQQGNNQVQGAKDGRGRQRNQAMLRGRPRVLDVSLYNCYRAFRQWREHPPDILSWIVFVSHVILLRRPEIVRCMQYSGIIALFITDGFEHVLMSFCRCRRHEPIYRIIVDEIMWCCSNERHLSPLIRAVIGGNWADISCLLANSHSVFDVDEGGRNALFWALIQENNDVAERLMSHAMEVMEQHLPDQASRWDFLRICLMALPFACPPIVGKIFEFVKRAVGNDDDFRQLISNPHVVYGSPLSGIDFTSHAWPAGRPEGYLLFEIVASGNHHAAKSLLGHDVDVNIVDMLTDRTVFELAKEYCTRHDIKMLEVLMSGQRGN